MQIHYKALVLEFSINQSITSGILINNKNLKIIKFIKNKYNIAKRFGHT
jgi:hypothetical protein